MAVRRSGNVRSIRAWGRWVTIAYLVVCLGFGGAWPGFAQPRDVPSDHWAHGAVAELIEAGYLTPFDDGTFRGEEPVDRYTFAAVVHRLLREVETGVGQVGAADLELLRQLSTEFRDELVAFYRVRDDLLASVEGSEKRVAVFDETLNRVIDTIVALEADAALVREEIARETEALRRLLAGETDALHLSLGEETAVLRAQLEEERQARQALEEETRQLREALEQEIGALIEREGEERALSQAGLRAELLELIAGLRAEAAVLDERLSQLEEDVSSSWEETLWLSERVEEVYDQVGELDSRLGAVEAQSAETEAQLGLLRADVTRLRAGLDELDEATAVEQEEIYGRLDRLEGSLEDQYQELLDRMAQLQETMTALLAADELHTAEQIAEIRSVLQRDLADLDSRLAQLQDRLAETEAGLVLLDQRVTEEGRQARAALDVLSDETQLLMDTHDALFRELDSLHGSVRSLEDRVGLSDDELARLTDRVREELAAQLNLSLMREQRMQRELEDLKQEFEGYRTQKEEETRSLRSSTSLAIGVAVVGILVGLFSK